MHQLLSSMQYTVVQYTVVVCSSTCRRDDDDQQRGLCSICSHAAHVIYSSMQHVQLSSNSSAHCSSIQ